MKPIKAIIATFLLTCFVHVIADAQQPQPNPLEAEYRTLSSSYRILSACPNLIEEWELEEIDSRIVSVKIMLERSLKTELPVSFRRGVIAQASAAVSYTHLTLPTTSRV